MEYTDNELDYAHMLELRTPHEEIEPEEGSPEQRPRKALGTIQLVGGATLAAAGVPFLVLPGPGTLMIAGGASLADKGYRNIKGEQRTEEEMAELKEARKQATDERSEQIKGFTTEKVIPASKKVASGTKKVAAGTAKAAVATAKVAKKGAQKAAPVVKKGAKATASAAKKGAQKAAPVVKKGAKATAAATKKGAQKAAEKAGPAVKRGAKAAGEAGVKAAAYGSVLAQESVTEIKKRIKKDQPQD
ncbi:MAG: hypothetical protein K6G78_00665 [bacterium]|nr:hypothetical protein [bacterium]